ncbi:MAG: ATPase [Bacteroidales bacterium]|jgi:predicted Fe-Mo cluster-binding NifX family protein|nr:ATPase [Bacteroidales bacterium]
MKKKIAIPLESDKVCLHFGHCETFAIVQVDNDVIVSDERLAPPSHEPGLYPKWLAEQGVTDVLASGIGQKAVALFDKQGICVHIGVEQKEVQEIVKDFLNNSLEISGNACNH